MRLRVLGCNGGIAPGHGTSAFLINDSVLVDCGTGVEALTVAEMARIRHVFLTHSHLDHIAHLPFLLNSIVNSFDTPVQVYGIAPTIEALKTHIFNDVIWPDFLKIPSEQTPCVVLNVIALGEERLFDDFRVRSVPVQHSIPATGYVVTSGDASVAFSGDCYQNDGFWAGLNQLLPVDMLIVDNQYASSDAEISRLAQHYYPALLKQDLQKLAYRPPLYLTNVPPYHNETMLAEIRSELSDWAPNILKTNDRFSL